jgi:hypothetical protein
MEGPGTYVWACARLVDRIRSHPFFTRVAPVSVNIINPPLPRSSPPIGGPAWRIEAGYVQTYMSNRILNGVQKVVATMTMTATVLSLSGFAALAPTVAQAAVPADYGLREGDVISADGATTDPNFDPDVYIVNDWGYKRLFLNPIIFSFYGHLGGFAAVKKVSPAARDAFPTSGLFRNCETNDQRVWGLEVTAEDSGILHWINTTGAQAVIDDPNFFKKVFCINNNEFNWYPKGSDYTSVNQVPAYSRGGAVSPTPTPTTTTSPTGLSGGAGSLQDATSIGSLTSEEVGEGENNVPVIGLDLEADSGSDLRVLSVKVSFEEQQAGGSEDLDDYADEVSVWFNGTKVATADVSDFNEDDGDADGANEWSKSISLTGDAIIRMSQTEDLRIAVSALDNIDSSDLGSANNDWDVTIDNVRYVDAQGAITTDDTTGDIPATEPFVFVDFAAAADLELNLNEASDNPESRVVDVDDTDETTNILLLSGELEATGGDIEVKEMTVNIASTGADLDAIASEVRLEVDGTVVQTLQTSECNGLGDCVFDDVDATINEDDTVKVRVLVDINGTDEFASGSTLLATIDNSDTVAEDENGDDLAAADLTGTANGEEVAFYDAGIMLEFVSADESKATANGIPDIGTFTITFDVTAFDTDAYVNQLCVNDDNQNAAGEGNSFVITGSSSYVSCDFDTNTGATLTSNETFEVLEGATERFTLTVAVEGDDDFVQVALEAVNWGDEDVASTSLGEYYIFNLDEFETGALFLSDGV